MSWSSATASIFKKWVLRLEPVPDIGLVCSGTHALSKKYVHVKEWTVIREALPLHRSQLSQTQVLFIFELWGIQSKKFGLLHLAWTPVLGGKKLFPKQKWKTDSTFHWPMKGKTGFCLSSLTWLGIFCIFSHPDMPASSSQEYRMRKHFGN